MYDEPMRAIPDEDHARIATDTFRMLSDPTRVKILWALLQDEASVNALADLVGASPTVVSQHLSKLKLAGLVDNRREGTFAHYSATDTHIHRLLAEALSHAEHLTGTATGQDPHTYSSPPTGRR